MNNTSLAHREHNFFPKDDNNDNKDGNDDEDDREKNLLSSVPPQSIWQILTAF
jgi:hypothetical protein